MATRGPSHLWQFLAAGTVPHPRGHTAPGAERCLLLPKSPAPVWLHHEQSWQSANESWASAMGDSVWAGMCVMEPRLAEGRRVAGGLRVQVMGVGSGPPQSPGGSGWQRLKRVITLMLSVVQSHSMA